MLKKKSMNKKYITYILSILVVCNPLFSPDILDFFNITSGVIIWIVNFLLILVILYCKKIYFNPTNNKDYWSVTAYLVWVLISVIRGILITENYWEWKQLVEGTLCLSLPIFVYVFSIPQILQSVLRFWVKYWLPLFVFIFVWLVKSVSYQFYLAPIFLLCCFLPLINGKWKLILATLLVIMIVADLGARSQVIKSFLTLLISVMCIFYKKIPYAYIKFIHLGLYFLPLLLLFGGLTGEINVFSSLSNNEGKYVQRRVINGETQTEDLTSDTRTAIYEEVLKSAIVNEYIWCGRTPARGNDSLIYGTFFAENLKTGKYERHKNEVCFPNVFTWIGLIGMILFCSLYLKSSYLSVFESNNVYIKLIGVVIAFHFAYGWVEDTIDFNILNITLWMMISMGFSERFRHMNNLQFKYWLIGIFDKQLSYENRNRI